MSIRQLLAGALEFQGKHPVLRRITVLLLILPALLQRLLQRYLAIESPLLQSDVPTWQQPLFLGSILILLLTSILQLWGTGSVLVTAKRLLGHPAGRTRTAVIGLMRDAAQYVPRLFFTGLLRLCTIGILLLPSLLASFFLVWNEAPWGITTLVAGLLLLPATFYGLHTVFYAVVIVGEDDSFRSALRRSAAALKGHRLLLCTRLLLLFVCTLGPAILWDQVAGNWIAPDEFSSRALLTDGIGSVLDGVGSLFSAITLTLLYGSLRTHTVERAGVPAVKRKAKTTKKAAPKK